MSGSTSSIIVLVNSKIPLPLASVIYTACNVTTGSLIRRDYL